MSAHLRAAWRSLAMNAAGAIPDQPPETAPVPSGHVRLWHRTPQRNADSIRRSGLGAEHSTQLEFQGEMVWGTFGFKGAVGDIDSASMTEWAFVEYHVPWSTETRVPTDIGSPQTSGSVPPQDIIAVWEPWHFAVWVVTAEIADGRYALEDMTFLIRDAGPAYATALEWLDRNTAPAWMAKRP